MAAGGLADPTTIYAGGMEIVNAGGTDNGARISGGTQLDYGHASGATVFAGSQVVEAGGIASGTTVSGSGMLELLGGATASDFTIESGGILTIGPGATLSGYSFSSGVIVEVASGGRALNTTVSSGGTMDVSSGSTASGVSVARAGTLNVSSGGVVSALTIKDPNDPGVTAAVNVLSGGTVDGATKIDGGQLILDAGADFQAHASLTIMNSGWLILDRDSFKGTIKDFGGSDELDLTKIRFTGATTETFTTSGAGGTLQVQAGSHVPIFIWPAPMRPRTSHSRAMVPTARWLLSSLDASLNGPPSEWSFPRSVRSFRSAEASMSVVGPSRQILQRKRMSAVGGITEVVGARSNRCW